MLIQAAATNHFFENPKLGCAIIEHFSEDYPHNLFIEAAMATSVLGLVLFIFVFVDGLRQFGLRLQADPLLLPLLAIQHLVASQVSGSIAASAPVWIMLSLLVSAPRVGDANQRFLYRDEQ